MRTNENNYIFEIQFQPKKEHELSDLIMGKSNMWFRSTHLVNVDEKVEIELDSAIKKCFELFQTIEYEDDKFKYRIYLNEFDFDLISHLYNSDSQCEYSKPTRDYIYMISANMRDDIIEEFELVDSENLDIEYYVIKKVIYNIDDITNHLIELSKRL